MDKLTEAQKALLQQQTSVLQAEDKLREQKFVAELVWQQAKAAVDRADAEWRAADFVYQTKRADQKMAQVSVAQLQKRDRKLQELAGIDRPLLHYGGKRRHRDRMHRKGRRGHRGARTPILSIFSPSDTYGDRFLQPERQGETIRGEQFDIDVQGIGQSAPR